jgi:hypothetical protein
MGWKEVNEKLHRRSQSYFVPCDTEVELDLIREAVREEFPRLKAPAVRDAVLHCCEMLSAPRARHRFLDCLKRLLECP